MRKYAVVTLLLSTMGLPATVQAASKSWWDLFEEAKTPRECKDIARRCEEAAWSQTNWVARAAAEREKRCRSEGEDCTTRIQDEKDEQAAEVEAEARRVADEAKAKQEQIEREQRQKIEDERRRIQIAQEQDRQLRLNADKFAGLKREMASVTAANKSQVALIAGSGGQLVWPTEGGIEQWGFSRPTQCASGQQHFVPWLQKVESNYWNGDVYFSNKVSASNYYESDKIRSFTSNPESLLNIQRRLVDLQKEINSVYDGARDYLKLLSSYSDGSKRVVDEFRTFQSPEHCELTLVSGRLSMSENLHCGILLRLIAVTDQLEQSVQLACRLGVPQPRYLPTAIPMRIPKPLPPVVTQPPAASNHGATPSQLPKPGYCSNGSPRAPGGVCTAQ